MSKFITLLMLTMVFALTNCGSRETVSNSNTAIVASGNQKNEQKSDTASVKSTLPTSEPANTTVAAGSDQIGVAECDEYITKVEACIFKKVPEPSRAMYQSSFEQMKKSWKDAATTPQGKSALAAGCKQATKTAKQSYTAFNCEF